MLGAGQSLSPSLGTQTASLDPYLAGRMQMETGGKPTMGYHDLSRSTAAGPFGITDSTWAGLAAAHPELNLMSSGARNDWNKNVAAATALKNDNAADLGRRGVANPTDPTSLAMADFLGPTAAAAILQSDPSTPVVDILNRVLPRATAARFLASNPEQLGRGQTAGQVRADVANRTGFGFNPGQGGQQSPAGGSGGPGGPSMSPQIPGMMSPQMVQANPLPPQPAGYAQPTSDQMDQAGRAAQAKNYDNNDLLLSIGMGLLGGTSLPQGMQLASQNVNSLRNNQTSIANNNADLQNDAYQRQFNLPLNAAQAAEARSRAWALANPNAVSPLEAAKVNNSAIDANNNLVSQYQLKQMQLDYMNGKVTGRPESMVDPGPYGASQAPYTRQQMANGTLEYRGPDGKLLDPNDPKIATLVPFSQYKFRSPEQLAQIKLNVPEADKMATTAIDAQNQDNRYKQSLAELNGKDGDPNLSQGFVGNLQRALNDATGMDLFGSNTGTRLSDLTLNQDILGQFQANAKGGQRMTNALRDFIIQSNGHLGDNPEAVRKLIGLLQQNNAIPMKLNEGWQSLTPDQRTDIIQNKSVAQWQATAHRNLLAGKTWDGKDLPDSAPVPPTAAPSAPSATPTPAPAAGQKPLPSLSTY